MVPLTFFCGEFTFSHHRELHLLFHNNILKIRLQDEGAVEGAAICPCVIEVDVMKVNGSYLNISVTCPMPLQTVAEVFMQDISLWVFIMEDLREIEGKKENILDLSTKNSY